MRTFAAVMALALMLRAGVAMPADEHHHGAAAAPHLKLNADKKWVADKHTVGSVASMKAIVRRVDRTSVAELQAAGRELQDQLQALVRGCTMTGPAHEELHAWIALLAPEIQALIQSDTADTARASVQRVARLLSAFDDYFAPAAD